MSSSSPPASIFPSFLRRAVCRPSRSSQALLHWLLWRPSARHRMPSAQPRDCGTASRPVLVAPELRCTDVVSRSSARTQGSMQAGLGVQKKTRVSSRSSLHFGEEIALLALLLALSHSNNVPPFGPRLSSFACTAALANQLHRTPEGGGTPSHHLALRLRSPYNMSAPTVYTMAEVAKHNTKDGECCVHAWRSWPTNGPLTSRSSAVFTAQTRGLSSTVRFTT